MNEVINTIEEIESMLERKVEWELNEYVEASRLKSVLQNLYGYTQQLKQLAEDVK